MPTAPTQNIAEERSASTKPLRFVTAASLFDGHDAAINVMRRLIQAQGAEVIVITDNSLSELAGKGTVTLYADIDSTFFVHSVVGPVSLVSALGAAIYSKDRDLYDARARLVRDNAPQSGWLR